MGLNKQSTSASYTDIDYAIYLQSNGRLSVYENGGGKGNKGSYNAGDAFEIRVNSQGKVR